MIPPDLLSLSTILLNIQDAIPQLMETYGIWVYAILFAVIFCETGLVFTPFLPGTLSSFSWDSSRHQVV